jgi:hypothetical protein
MKIRFRSGAFPDVIDVLRKQMEPGEQYILTLSKKRTLDQNAYFHAVIVPAFCQCTGYSKHKAKKMLKKGFEVESTADLSKTDMTELIRDCRIWLWHHYRCALPEAGDMMDEMSDEMMIDLDKTFYF